MKVTLVSIRPTAAADAAGRPALTPEFLAATGARYSRSDLGLEGILEQIDPADPDASVERIFKFVDYGHASIGDMAPVPLFIDEISMWLAYLLFLLSPTAGGQESSTRYIRLDQSGLIDPELLGIKDPEAWRKRMAAAFAAYEAAIVHWEGVAKQRPDLIRIPKGTPEKAAARMRRNFVFDRARYFLPVAVATNVMLVMSARAWVQLCQQLLSHPLPEAQACGKLILEELGLATPRLTKHAHHSESFANDWQDEFANWQALAAFPCPHLAANAVTYDATPTAHLEVFPPAGMNGSRFARALSNHDNRYAPFGSWIRRTAVRFSWDAVAFAEIRDFNRHRTGTRFCPLAPVGFYHATDQLPEPDEAYSAMGEVGRVASALARTGILDGNPGSVYETLLGTQYSFEHTTTADKFLYEAELRTGLGAHYRYARHLRETLQLWYKKYPETIGLVLEGSAEPE